MKISLSLLTLALVQALGLAFAGVPDAQASSIKGAKETIATEKVEDGQNCGPFPNLAWWINDPAKIIQLE